MLSTMHPFEASGLGKAPFRFVFCYSLPPASLAEHNPSAYNAALRDMPQGMGCGTCRHCGMAIMHNFIVESSDGRRSAVGSDCVMKTNQRELSDAVKAERKAMAAKAREARRHALREAFLNSDAGNGETQLQRSDRIKAERLAENVARLEKQAADKAAEIANSRHVGTVGQRRDFALTFVRRAAMPGTYGTFYIQTFADADGASIVYKGGSPIMQVLSVAECNRLGVGSAPRQLQAGDVVKVKATIKSHGDYNGVKQTIISRAKNI